MVGQNVLLVERYVDGREDQVNQLAPELVAAQVDAGAYVTRVGNQGCAVGYYK